MSATEGRGEWTQVFSGRQFFPFDPRPEEVDILDIAHALSMICRFGGHASAFYSVAEHSVRASRLVPPEDALWALLHDASEAYLGDIVRPLKHSAAFSSYRDIEARMMRVICERFGLDPIEPESVRRADEIMLATEQRDLMKRPPEKWYLTQEPLPGRIYRWDPQDAESVFLTRFEAVGGKL